MRRPACPLDFSAAALPAWTPRTACVAAPLQGGAVASAPVPQFRAASWPRRLELLGGGAGPPAGPMTGPHMHACHVHGEHSGPCGDSEHTVSLHEGGLAERRHLSRRPRQPSASAQGTGQRGARRVCAGGWSAVELREVMALPTRPISAWPQPSHWVSRGSHTVIGDALCLLLQLGAGRPLVGGLHTDVAGSALGSQLPTGACAQPPGGPQGDLAVQRRFWN